MTHTHEDHWVKLPQKTVPKSIKILCNMNGNSNLLKAQSFTNITSLSLENSVEFKGIILNKTRGSHGTTEMYATPQLTEILGEAMGVTFQAKGYPTVYLIGNTI